MRERQTDVQRPTMFFRISRCMRCASSLQGCDNKKGAWQSFPRRQPLARSPGTPSSTRGMMPSPDVPPRSRRGSMARSRSSSLTVAAHGPAAAGFLNAVPLIPRCELPPGRGPGSSCSSAACLVPSVRADGAGQRRTVKRIRAGMRGTKEFEHRWYFLPGRTILHCRLTGTASLL